MYHDAYFAVEQALVGRDGKIAYVYGHVIGDDVGDAIEYPHAVNAVDFYFDQERFAQMVVPSHRYEA